MKRYLLFIPIITILFYFFDIEASLNQKQFFINLSENLPSNNTSFCLSPYSIRSCLCMLNLGANEETAQEFDRALYPTQYRSNTPFFNKALSTNDSYTFETACKIYVDQQEILLEEFLKTSERLFKAKAEQINFSNPDKSAKTINAWIGEKTQNLIQKFVDPSDIDGTLRILLLNTLCFKGSWQSPFDKYNTKERSFYFEDKIFPLNFLIKNDSYQYFEDEKCQITILPFKSSPNYSQIGFVIYLPKESTEKPLKDSLEYFSNLKILDFESHNLHLEIPKFQLSKILDLNDPLQKLGIKKAFNFQADFSKINGKKNLYLSKVLHNCYIELNESGVSAAAVTGAFMNLKCIGEKQLVTNFIANKPFAFMIMDLSNDTCLFAGQFFSS